MIRFILAVLALFICGMSGPAEAAPRHRHHHHHRTHFAVRHHAPALAPVRTDIHEQHHAEQGVPHMAVTPSASGQFHAMAAEFVAMGYSVGRPSCLSAGHMAHSKHHWGGACDLFNQVARNRTALRQPPPAIQIAVAAHHGLTSGCVWRNPDCGHFEVPTPGHAVFYSPRYRHRARLRLAWGLTPPKEPSSLGLTPTWPPAHSRGPFHWSPGSCPTSAFHTLSITASADVSSKRSPTAFDRASRALAWTSSGRSQ